jgi:hypothetical protein
VTSPAPRPTLFLIAGPNGAGKSAFYNTVLKPRVQAPFINADMIQRDELKNPSVEAAYEAANIPSARRGRRGSGSSSSTSILDLLISPSPAWWRASTRADILFPRPRSAKGTRATNS